MERRNEGKGRHDWIAVSFALAFHHSIVPAFRPDGRRPRDPLRRHDRGHRPRAGDDRHAAHARSGEHPRPRRECDRESRQRDAEATRRLCARRGGIRGRQHHARRLSHAAAGGCAARRASCAALAAAVQGKPKVRGTVVAAFTVRSLYATTGVEAVQSLQGPFAEALLLWSGRRTAAGRAPADTLALATRYTDTAVETVSLKDGDALAKRLVRWMEAR